MKSQPYNSLANKQENILSELREPGGGYDKVVYGDTQSFARNPDGSSDGVFFEYYTTKKVPFKMRSSYIYTDVERIILQSMIAVPGKIKGGIVIVLDEEGYVSLAVNPRE